MDFTLAIFFSIENVPFLPFLHRWFFLGIDYSRVSLGAVSGKSYTTLTITAVAYLFI